MKLPAILLCSFIIVANYSCGDTSVSAETNKDKSADAATKSVEQEHVDTTAIPATATPPKKFATISELIEDLGDYTQENGSFKILSSKPLHIQISNLHSEGTSEDNIKKQSMQSIVYVAYQTFASTGIDDITITSVPVMYDFDAGKVTSQIAAAKYSAKINRERAKQVMQVQVGVDKFEDLLGVATDQGNYFANSPNKKFEELKSERLVEDVFSGLKGK